jgi:hypothetical protein
MDNGKISIDGNTMQEKLLSDVLVSGLYIYDKILFMTDISGHFPNTWFE